MPTEEKLRIANRRMQDVADELMEALMFYADPTNWDFDGERDCVCGCWSRWKRDCWCQGPAEDYGVLARAVLGYELEVEETR